MEYVFSLSYKDEPNYSFIIKSLKRTLKKHMYSCEYPKFDWIKEVKVIDQLKLNEHNSETPKWNYMKLYE